MPPCRSSTAAAQREQGYTLMLVVAMLAALSIGLAVIGPRWQTTEHRLREVELLRLGELYAKAIADFAAASPGALRQYPRALDELVLDPRFAGTVRYLRRVYPDPVQPNEPWGLVTASDGSIRGVFSQSTREPLRTEPWSGDIVDLPRANRYEQWKFVPRRSEP